MSDTRLRYLFHRWFDKTATAEERAELMALLGSSEDEDGAYELLREAWEKLGKEERVFSEEQSKKMLEGILRPAGMQDESRTDVAEQERGKAKLTMVRRLMAAAAVLLLLGASVWLLVVRHGAPRGEKIASAMAKQAVKNIDVPAPSGNHAILTLADGSTVVLDSVQNGDLAQQGNAKVSKTNAGKLIYNALGQTPGKVVYNTVSTRRGGSFQIVLPDGSKVWLNTVSSLRFPTAFAGTERVVELKGEAYFEVAKNAAMPFVVHVNTSEDKGMDVRVLGTHFNVMAYDNEAEIRTTLLEGAVKVMKGDNSRLLSPGQQAKVDKHGGLSLDKSPDVELAMAWKNGFTSFKSADIRSIMRQVERWYDIDVVYEGNVPERTFSGGISREANLSELIRLLEVSKIHFTIEGRKLTVTP